jgi:hypothetical protein
MNTATILPFPIDRCRKGNLQLQEEAIKAFEEALAALQGSVHGTPDPKDETTWFTSPQSP